VAKEALDIIPDPEKDPVIPPVTLSDPDIILEPVTFKLPVGILTVPNNVCTSSAASPNWLEPEEYFV
jgi:hypothetical protein